MLAGEGEAEQRWSFPVVDCFFARFKVSEVAEYVCANRRMTSKNRPKGLVENQARAGFLPRVLDELDIFHRIAAAVLNKGLACGRLDLIRAAEG